jgi:ribonuclease HI
MGNRVIAACDGACKGNPGPAAWAWVIADERENVVRWEAGPLGQTTNNVAELTALRELLSAVDGEAELEVRMDSQYAMNAVTKWIAGWKRNGWRTTAKKPVANKDLVVAIDDLLTERARAPKFVYVAAHQVGGDRLNDLADRAASAAAVSQRPADGVSAEEVPDAFDGPGPTRPTTRQQPARAGGNSGPRTFPAKFRGTCRCGRTYQAGESIARVGDG